MTTLSAIITPTNLVTATGTETLTNKTLTSPTIASANLTTALTLAGAAGSNGQVLTSSGTGSAPTWVTASAGAMTFISLTTVSSSVAQVDITSGFSSTYDDYLFIVENVVGPTNLAMRVQKSAAFQTANYNISRTLGQAGGPTYEGSAGESRWVFLSANGMSNTNRIYGTIYLLNVNNTTGRTGCSAQLGNIASTSNSGMQSSFTGEQTTTAAITGVRFFDANSNNLTDGTFRLYGIQKS